MHAATPGVAAEVARWLEQLSSERRMSPKTLDAYARDDGLWDLEARISDVKPRETLLATGILPANSPIHDMWLRITVDLNLTIMAAEAVSDAVPYAGYCDTIAPVYQRLVGLNLMKGFRKAVKERLGAVSGCTHLTELTQILPTAGMQAFAGDVFPTRDLPSGDDDDGEHKPFQLDKCHALRTDGPVVALYYPRWVAKPGSGDEPN